MRILIGSLLSPHPFCCWYYFLFLPSCFMLVLSECFLEEQLTCCGSHLLLFVFTRFSYYMLKGALWSRYTNWINLDPFEQKLTMTWKCEALMQIETHFWLDFEPCWDLERPTVILASWHHHLRELRPGYPSTWASGLLLTACVTSRSTLIFASAAHATHLLAQAAFVLWSC